MTLCEYFAVKEIKLKGQKEMFADEKSYQALIVVEGTLELIAKNTIIKMNLGETVFIPANLGEYMLSGNATVLIANNPPDY